MNQFMHLLIAEEYMTTAGGATAVLPSSWPTAAGYQMVPTLYAADAAAAGGFYNQTAFVPQLAVAQMPQVCYLFIYIYLLNTQLLQHMQYIDRNEKHIKRYRKKHTCKKTRI